MNYGGQGVVYSQNLGWVAVGADVHSSNTILWSPNGTDWTPANTGGFGSVSQGTNTPKPYASTYFNTGYGVATNNSMFVAVGTGTICSGILDGIKKNNLDIKVYGITCGMSMSKIKKQMKN
jgi:hypothetical protein